MAKLLSISDIKATIKLFKLCKSDLNMEIRDYDNPDMAISELYYSSEEDRFYVKFTKA